MFKIFKGYIKYTILSHLKDRVISINKEIQKSSDTIISVQDQKCNERCSSKEQFEKYRETRIDYFRRKIVSDDERLKEVISLIDFINKL